VTLRVTRVREKAQVWVYAAAELRYLVLQMRGHKKHTTIILLTNE